MESNVLITGGTSGIGLETARVFLLRGYNVFITGLTQEEVIRTLNKLKTECSGEKVQGIALDLSEGSNAEYLYNYMLQKNIKIDILVNNAGFGTYGNVIDIPAERELAMIQLLVNNVYLLTRLFLKDMVLNNKGTVVNISSISAFQPNPTLATYGACKAFVYQFSRALNEELKDIKSDVRCISICPTPVRTAFQSNAGMENSSLFNSWMTVEAPFVAGEIFKAIEKRKNYIVPGIIYHWASKISKRLPEHIQISLAKTHLKAKR